MNLTELYQELAAAQPVSAAGVERRLAPHCPLDLFAFAEKPSNRLGFRVVLPSSALAAGQDLPTLRGLILTRQKRAEGISLILSASSEAFYDVFVSLVSDLAAQAEQETEAQAAAMALLDRLARWQTFLKNLPPEGLGPEAQRGLYGELWLLRHQVLPHWTAHRAVQAWTGPFRTGKDFQFPGGSVEVKTSIAGGDQRLEIHGERQLDDTGLTALLLAHLSLEPMQAAGEALPAMVQAVRAMTDAEFTAQQALEDRLREVGYLDVHEPKYRSPGYLVRELNLFHVHDGFPRLTEASLPLGVGNVTYKITVSACEAFRASEAELGGLGEDRCMGEQTDSLVQFATDIQQQVLSRSQLEGEEEFAENVFTGLMLEMLGEAGETEDAQLCPHQAGTGAQSMKVSAWAESGGENADECLDLFVTVYTGEAPPRTTLKDEMTVSFSKLKRFAAKAFQGYHYQLEESSRIFDACQRIDEIMERITRIRFILLTDGIVKADAPASADIDMELNGKALSYRATYQVWDLERFYRLSSSGRQQEPIEIDFVEKTGAAVPCVAQPAGSAEYAAYLAIIPGSVLAYLYGEYGSRLLERNVRSFLQARGKINAGIRTTIRKEPHMFLAYNNGLSMTAESVELAPLPGGGCGLKAVRDLQIVNGGQTTASIFHAQKKDKADLSGLFVQAKLTVICDPARVDAIVPLISEFANSQNKIQTADFAANDGYHREVERLSRTIWAPAREGSQRQTHWYYERARGQYQDDMAREGSTPARQKEFLAINPKAQFFAKVDVAKYIQTWEQRPHIVSKGAQYCFSDFGSRLDAHLTDTGPASERYFQDLIAKAILFIEADGIMKSMKGATHTAYKANLVTYTLARLAYDTKGRIDLGRIWREQALTPALKGAIADYSRHVWEHITHPPGVANVTQYCKQLSCWETFLARDIPFPKALTPELRDASAAPSGGAVRDRRPEVVRKVMALSSEEWFALAEWGKKNDALNGLQLEIVCKIASDIGYGREVSSRQSTLGWGLLADARRQGYRG